MTRYICIDCGDDVDEEDYHVNYSSCPFEDEWPEDDSSLMLAIEDPSVDGLT